MSPQPFYQDDRVTLFLGDCREVLPELDIQPDLVIADPPYQETSLAWDRWPDGWPSLVAKVTSSMWCFGSMRMFLDRRDEFTHWKLSQDVVWEKSAGVGVATDRFRRVHEYALHWYRGRWSDIHHETPRTAATPEQIARNGRATRQRGGKAEHLGKIGRPSVWTEDGTRLARSVISVPWMRGKAIHPTEKPVELLRPLIEYGCPPGGLILDPFAGSCSTGVAAKMTGRRAALIEADEAMCEKAVRLRLAQDMLPLAVPELPAAQPPQLVPHKPDCEVCECGERGQHPATPDCRIELDCVPGCPHYWGVLSLEVPS